MSMVHRDLFIFDNVIRITLKVPSVRIILSVYRKFKWQKLPLEGRPRFLSRFPVVNLQMKSIVKSLRPIKS